MTEILTLFGVDLTAVAQEFAFPVGVAAVVLTIIINEWENGGSLPR